MDISPNLRLQDDLNTFMIFSSLILETERYLCVTEDSKWSDKCYFFLVVNGEANLMIVRIGI
jgi:hypothetical protein